MPKSDHQTKLGELNEPGPDAGTSDDEKSVAKFARERAAEEARHAREAAAETAREKAGQVRDAAESFDADSFARQITERIADDLGQAARSVRGADIGSVAEDMSDFARRQPVLFYGGAALLGFAAARMLKASERAEQRAGQGAEQGNDASASSDPWGAM